MFGFARASSHQYYHVLCFLQRVCVIPCIRRRSLLRHAPLDIALYAICKQNHTRHWRARRSNAHLLMRQPHVTGVNDDHTHESGMRLVATMLHVFRWHCIQRAISIVMRCHQIVIEDASKVDAGGQTRLILSFGPVFSPWQWSNVFV